ncbi:hypothetical protein DIPPA_06866 [Diplonema papillatum]|nr:hypothetical protein DIPPA_06866 [Diplonema papillatum]
MSASINSAHVFTALIRMAGDDWQFAETLRQQQQQCSVAESDAFRQQLKCVYEKAGLQDKARAVSKMASLPHAVVTRVHQI